MASLDKFPRSSQQLLPVALTCCLFIANPAAGQTPAPTTAMPPLPPVQPAVDRNNFNITSEYYPVDTLPSVKIGNDQANIAFHQNPNGSEYQGGKLRFQLVPIYNGGFLVARVASDDGQVHVFSLGTISPTMWYYTPAWNFYPSGHATVGSAPDAFSSMTNDGTLLICYGAATNLYQGKNCNLTGADGRLTVFKFPNTTYLFDVLLHYNASANATVDSNIAEIDLASGEKIFQNYASDGTRRSSETTTGFRIYAYDAKTLVAINTSKEYRDPLAINPTVSAQALSGKNVAINSTDFDRYENGVWAFRSVGSATNTITRPSGRVAFIYAPSDGAANTTGINPDVTVYRNRAITKNGKLTTYSYGNEPGFGQQGYPKIWYWKYDDPNGAQELFKIQEGIVQWKVDELGRTTIYNYSGLDGVVWGFKGLAFSPQLGSIVTPDNPSIAWSNGNPSGNVQQGGIGYGYTHGAISSVTQYPTDGSAPLTTTYAIPATCDITNYVVCNKPQYIVDPKGNRTDYTWSTVHGGLLTETAPADANGVRPQKRYTYTQLYPKALNSSGVLVNSPPVWRVTKLSQCASATAANQASCVGTAAETVTTYAYNDNNLFLTSVTTAAGDGSKSSTISYTYDYAGNQTSVDGPRTDVDDRSYKTYDALRRPVFEIGIDPDGAGSLPRQIVHHVYDVDGNEVKAEVGTGNATDGSDFVVSHFKRMTYDPVTGLLSKTEEVVP